ncbi:MAG: EpsG family protein [Candidatus Calescibacterium sp.]
MPMERNANMHFKHEKLKELIKMYIFTIISLILIIIPVFLPLGFSPDSLNYYKTIDLPPSRFNFLSFEPFYWLVVYVNQILFNGSWASFLLFFSFIYVSLNAYLIYKYSPSPFLSFLIFMLLFYPNFGLIQIRDGVSIAFAWWAIFNLMEGKKIRFIIKTIIAILFHYPSIIFFLALFLNKNRINRKFYLLLPIFGLLLGKYVLNLEVFKLIVSYLPGFLKHKAQSYLYLLESQPEHILNQVNILNSYVLFIILVYYVSLFTYRSDNYSIFFTKMVGFATFFWFSFMNVPVFSFRFSNKFNTFLVFLIPYILNSFRKDERALIYLLLILMLVLLSWNIYIRHKLFDFSIL